ncbi:MAG: fatty acid desaturase [Rhodobacteraceae bacterium]|nr:fatty acid desaturase [Paracoccaceae bacterium]
MNNFQKPKSVEWPTLLLIITCTAVVFLVSFYSDMVTLWLSLPVLTVALALHSSLQHEVLHGHPFANKYANEALVFVPFGLFLPYRRFRDTHIQHHFDPNLTDPYDDPETNFQDPEIWVTLGPLTQMLLRVNNTLAGRMLVGPMISFVLFYRDDMREIRAGNRGVINAYLLHFVGLIPMVIWLITLNSMPVWAYILASYGGISLLKVRTFLEHRAHDNCAARSVIIEDRGFFALLFLNNNLHAVHHANPELAWYKIPQVFRADRAQYLTDNDGYQFTNYREIFRNYLFKAKDPVPHPIWNKSNRTQPK